MYRQLLERLVRVCGRHPGWEIVVVTRYKELLSEIEELPVVPVFCEDSRRGASYSIRAGILAETPGEQAEALAFFVADQPFLTEETAESFLETMEAARASLGCVSHEGETGNPVWFSREYVPELLALSGDMGGRRVLKAHLETARLFPVENPGELEDMDQAPEETKPPEETRPPKGNQAAGGDQVSGESGCFGAVSNGKL